MIDLHPRYGQLSTDAIRSRQNKYRGIENARICMQGLKTVDFQPDTENGNNDIIGIATTDDVDEQDEVVLPEGADLSYIMATRMLYADHMYGLGQVIGSIRHLKPLSSGRGWQFRARMFDGLQNPLASDTLEIIKQSGKLGVSIGFDALDWGTPTDEEAKRYPLAKSIVRKWRWIELSVTARPCNVNAYAMAATPSQMSKSYTSAIVEMIQLGRIKRESAAALGLSEYGVSRVIKLGGEPPAPKLLRLG